MNAVLQTAPAVAIAGGLPVALAIAAAATALVAVAIVVVAALRRGSRITAITGGIGAASAATLLLVALAVGGALTQSPAAVASTPVAERNASGPYAEKQLEGFQLPTLELSPDGGLLLGTDRR